MEDIGSEVSQKIRAAIKAKLIELGAYVDDELPDYIMVMVANKRTRSQMDDDLQLFLSSNTKIFTSWLHTVLQKLQEVTVASFENKKDSDSKKLSKRKKSETEDGRSRKSSEEGVEKVKKHSKKHKESKKGRRNKHKTKSKGKKSEKESSKEKSGKEDEKKTSQEKTIKNKNVELNEAVGRAILGDLKKCKKLKSDKNESSSQSSSSSDEESKLDDKSIKENENGSNKPVAGSVGEDVTDKPAAPESIKKNTREVIEDEFNIEPLKPTEKDSEVEMLNDIELQGSARSKEIDLNVELEKTVSAPTEELLKEHDKIQSEKFEGETTREKKPKSDSEESLSPEEIRKELLLSRAKKKLEESKKAERMRSNSPDVLIVEETVGGRQKDLMSTSSKQPEARSTHSEGKGSSRSGSPRPSKQRSSLYSERRSPLSSERSTFRRIVMDLKSKQSEEKSSNGERRKISFGRLPSPEKEKTGDRKRSVIKISESLQLEKNLGMKKESETKPKDESSKKRPVPSRVVTITGPDVPEIPSIVKVKPREFISKDKQANKALILKAVADAEKSIATVHARPDIEPEPKKEALYTKNLREKRYEKLAITLSNLRRNVSAHDRLDRRVSVESDKSDKKRDSSDVSDGVRVLSKKMSKSDDQFISSKTTVMEKNDKYIRCWLEGVEKAVKDEEMINPSDMDDLTNVTEEDNDEEKKRKRKSTEAAGDTSSKALKVRDEEGGIAKVLPDSGQTEDEPQIVVTLDGLDSKAIKDLILKNKESTGRPLLGSSAATTAAAAAAAAAGEKKLEKSGRGVQPGEAGFEKISDRFGRLNKANENEVGRGEKKGSNPPAGEEPTEKKAKTESKNRQLIAQLSEKFGKVDREFESRKRKRPEEERRYAYDSRRSEMEDGERNGRYRKSERRSFMEGRFGFYRRS